MNHDTIAISVREEIFDVDTHVADLVLLMNRIPKLHTISSCQGEPGIIGKDGFYGHVAFSCGDWMRLCDFCYWDLRGMFEEFIDDEIRVDIFCKSQPYAWLLFRAEMLPLVSTRIAAMVTGNGW